MEKLNFVSYFIQLSVYAVTLNHNQFSTAISRSVKQTFYYKQTQRFNNFLLNCTQSQMNLRNLQTLFFRSISVIFSILRLARTWDVTELYAL